MSQCFSRTLCPPPVTRQPQDPLPGRQQQQSPPCCRSDFQAIWGGRKGHRIWGGSGKQKRSRLREDGGKGSSRSPGASRGIRLPDGAQVPSLVAGLNDSRGLQRDHWHGSEQPENLLWDAERNKESWTMVLTWAMERDSVIKIHGSFLTGCKMRSLGHANT